MSHNCGFLPTFDSHVFVSGPAWRNTRRNDVRGQIASNTDTLIVSEGWCPLSQKNMSFVQGIMPTSLQSRLPAYSTLPVLDPATLGNGRKLVQASPAALDANAAASSQSDEGALSDAQLDQQQAAIDKQAATEQNIVRTAASGNSSFLGQLFDYAKASAPPMPAIPLPNLDSPDTYTVGGTLGIGPVDLPLPQFQIPTAIKPAGPTPDWFVKFLAPAPTVSEREAAAEAQAMAAAAPKVYIPPIESFLGRSAAPPTQVPVLTTGGRRLAQQSISLNPELWSPPPPPAAPPAVAIEQTEPITQAEAPVAIQQALPIAGAAAPVAAAQVVLLNMAAYTRHTKPEVLLWQ